MKRLFKKFVIALIACFLVLGVAACDPTEVDQGPTLEEVQTSSLSALDIAYSAIDLNQYDDETVVLINAVYENAKTAIQAATDIEAVRTELSNATTQMSNILKDLVKLASGVYSYVASSYADRTEILGILEKYAVKAGLTGLTVFEDSGYVLYKSSVVKGTNNYIPGYGFGTLAEGTINADLAGETNSAWKRYYHTFQSEDPASINYGDDKGSVVGDLASYIYGSYWSTRMNETKDGYEWYSELANERPQAVNASSVTGLATKYKFEVKTGSQLKYSTLSTVFGAKYNDREVTLDDYVTPYKLVHTQSNGYARGSENLTGASAIKGMSAYYNASTDGYNEVAWNNVGIKASVENGKSYLEIEFVQPCSSFYAMYYLASSIYAPVPQEFIDEIGGPKAYGKYVSESGYTPVDTTLATGQFVLESWETDKQIVFKNNPNVNEEGRYSIAGVHVAVLAAINTDSEAALKEYQADKLHSCGIPYTRLNELKNSEEASQTVGSSTTKLNINTCTPEEWEYLFGENGTITKTEKENYWEVEAALSNEAFILGLSYAINRAEFAESNGRTPSVSYYGSAYMSDPENGISYNSTQAHKDAIAELLQGTDEYGYSLELARASFKEACTAMLASGQYKEGDTIEIEIAWQTQSNITQYHNTIKKYWEDAFNDPSVCEGKLTLSVVPFVGASWSDVYYEKMMPGQYDIGFGGITGNPLNPLNFFEVLKSDNSSGFTLNWGPDTNAVSTDLIWQEQAWSFDALWQAAETGGYFEQGLFVPNYDVEVSGDDYATLNADGTVTLTFKGNILNGIEGIDVELYDVVIYGYFDDAGQAAYDEDTVGEANFSYDEATDIITVTVSPELYEKYSAALSGRAFGIDFKFDCVVLEIDSSTIQSVSIALPKATN